MKLTCIICPMGCELKIKDGDEFKVTGHLCPRGVKYARDEMTDPRRVYTGNIQSTGGVFPVISYKTNTMRKADLTHLQEITKNLVIAAPIKLGDVLYQDDKMTIIATRTLDKA